MTGPRVFANVWVPAPDGTALATDAYVPPGQEPVPVVVTRTPYDRSAHLAEGLGWAGHGLGYVVQDVRGRYGSDGCWVPYRNERGDGGALLDWVVRQSWCDGRIIAYGASYTAYTAWTMAIERPHLVRAVLSLCPAMGLSRVKFDKGGILRLAEHAGWWLERAESRTSRPGLSAAMLTAQQDLLSHLPVTDLPRLMWARLNHWVDAIEAGPDHLAPEAVTDDELATLPAAVLHIGGWYDLLIGENLHQWDVAGSALACRPRRGLVVGPWEHDLAWAPSTVVGCRDHGPDSRIHLGALELDWIRRVLEDAHRTDPAEPRDRAAVFVIGANHWWRGRQWPPPTVDQTWFAHPDGALAQQCPMTDGHTSFRYDPARPFPSADPGVDRTSLAARVDAVRYTSTPVPAQITVAGCPVAQLWASSSVVATDFVVRLNEITTEGHILALTQGTVDTGRAHSHPYRIELDPIAVRVAAGSRLQLEVCSSDFPYLARHLNTTGDRYHGTAMVTAVQTVYVGGSQPTAVILPIME
jgi:putative CocE/NonD family hydrolase